MKDMYVGMANSPETTLAVSISATDTVIEVLDVSVFPDGPNLAVIGTDENAETIKYATKTATALSGCTRGVEGVAKEWRNNEVIARNFTNLDYQTLIDNVNALENGKVNDEVYKLDKGAIEESINKVKGESEDRDKEQDKKIGELSKFIEDNVKLKIEELESKALNEDLSLLTTSDKATLVGAINEVKKGSEDKNKRQDVYINGLLNADRENKSRIAEVKNKNSTQDSRLDFIESRNSSQDSKISAIESKDKSQDAKIRDIERVDENQNRRLDFIEGKNSSQDNKISAIESKNKSQDSRISSIENRMSTHNNSYVYDGVHGLKYDRASKMLKVYDGSYWVDYRRGADNSYSGKISNLTAYANGANTIRLSWSNNTNKDHKEVCIFCKEGGYLQYCGDGRLVVENMYNTSAAWSVWVPSPNTMYYFRAFTFSIYGTFNDSIAGQTARCESASSSYRSTEPAPGIPGRPGGPSPGLPMSVDNDDLRMAHAEMMMANAMQQQENNRVLAEMMTMIANANNS